MALPFCVTLAPETDRGFMLRPRKLPALSLDFVAGPVAAALMGVAVVATAPSASAADLTEVADAADEDDPFDANIELDFDFMRHTGLIVRENTQDPGNGEPRTVRVRELDYERIRFRLTPRVEVGVFHDLAVFAQIPIILFDQTQMKYTQGTNDDNSTVHRDQAPNGVRTVDGWPQTQGSGGDRFEGNGYGFPATPYNQWRFAFDNNAGFTGNRAGFGYPTFGARWSPVNNSRDSSKPTITLQGDVTPAFFIPVMDPTNDTLAQNAPGPVADGAHRFHVGASFSKRYLFLDPFFSVNYTLPIAGPNAVYGFEPRQDGGFSMGLEIIPWENKEIDSKVAVNVHFRAHYFSKGRDYSELSDALNELTYTDEYMRTSANFGVFYRVFKFLNLSLLGSATYDTNHFLTSESIGCDGGCPDPNNPFSNPDGPKNNLVDLGEAAGERNQFFNPVYDTPGRRFIMEDSIQVRILAHVAVTF